MGTEPGRWSFALRVLHWGMALMLAGLAVIGLVMVHAGLEIGARFALYQWHKSVGILVLGLAVLRLLIRLGTRRPQPLGSPRARRLAVAGQTLIYAVLLALPLSGWIMASASPFRVPTILFGAVRLPALTGPDAALEALARSAHEALAIALAILVIGHVAAALKHHFGDRDDTLRRMGFRKPA